MIQNNGIRHSSRIYNEKTNDFRMVYVCVCFTNYCVYKYNFTDKKPANIFSSRRYLCFLSAETWIMKKNDQWSWLFCLLWRINLKREAMCLCYAFVKQSHRMCCECDLDYNFEHNFIWYLIRVFDIDYLLFFFFNRKFGE